MRHAFRALALLLMSLPLSGCLIAESEQAAAGKTDIIGLTRAQVRMCAGFPTKTATEGDFEIWSYERSRAAGSSVTLPTLPTLISIPGPSFSQNSTTDCRAQVRFAEDHVVEVAYAGATDVMGATDAACGPIVKGCIGYRSGKKPAPARPVTAAAKKPAAAVRDR